MPPTRSRARSKRVPSASRPVRFTQREPRKWLRRLEPPVSKARRPRGLQNLWGHLRRLLWSWRPWTLGFLTALVFDAWIWAGFAGLFAVFTYVVAPSERAPVFGLDHEMGVESEEFLHSMIGLTGAPFFAGNAVQILNNGDEFYPSMLEALRNAKASITIEAYIYWKGRIGVEFARALADRARSGVSVKILLDTVGSATIGPEILSELEAGGCQVAWFNPPRWYGIGWLNHRTHRKSLIVDGRIGFTGGAGIADIWTGDAEDEEHWRDVQVRVEGPGVMPLQTGFSQNWQVTTGELVNGPAFFPELLPAGPVLVQTIMSSPSAGASSARTLYYLSIVCARHTIQIANPYFVPDPQAIGLLVDAKRRGVDVTIMVSGAWNDNWLARQNSVRVFGPLLKAGIGIYDYNRTMLHHKTMVVDGRWATIGTTNFDDRSFTLNDETNLSFVDPELVDDMMESFAEDLATCDRVTLAGWRRRGLVQRGGEVVASLFRNQV